MIIEIKTSVGDLLDRLSILKIKLEKISDLDKKKYIEKEFHELNQIYNPLKDIDSDILYNKLYDINKILWGVEDKLRIKEQFNQFDSDFIDLARQVYKINDERYFIKNKINVKYNCYIQEQKSYRNV
jgi:hypothetical protein